MMSFRGQEFESFVCCEQLRNLDPQSSMGEVCVHSPPRSGERPVIICDVDVVSLFGLITFCMCLYAYVLRCTLVLYVSLCQYGMFVRQEFVFGCRSYLSLALTCTACRPIILLHSLLSIVFVTIATAYLQYCVLIYTT